MKQLQEEDSRELERREKGFTVYLNSAIYTPVAVLVALCCTVDLRAPLRYTVKPFSLLSSSIWRLSSSWSCFMYLVCARENMVMVTGDV